jgi:SCO1/SenC
MARVPDELGPDFGTKVAFLSITVDPGHDTPEVLKEYATALGANLAVTKLSLSARVMAEGGGMKGTSCQERHDRFFPKARRGARYERGGRAQPLRPPRA